MAKRAKNAEGSPSQRVSTLRDKLADAVRHARQEIEKVSDPKAQALLETTAEVLDGLIRACDHAEQKSEPAWM
jgi:hypothetical protein